MIKLIFILLLNGFLMKTFCQDVNVNVNPCFILNKEKQQIEFILSFKIENNSNSDLFWPNTFSLPDSIKIKNHLIKKTDNDTLVVFFRKPFSDFKCVNFYSLIYPNYYWKENSTINQLIDTIKIESKSKKEIKYIFTYNQGNRDTLNKCLENLKYWKLHTVIQMFISKVKIADIRDYDYRVNCERNNKCINMYFECSYLEDEKKFQCEQEKIDTNFMIKERHTSPMPAPD